MATPNRLSIIKFLELALTISCLGLHYESISEPGPAKILLIAGTYVGFTVILVALFAGYLMSTPINKRLDMFFSIVAVCMFVASGAVIIDHWKNYYDSDIRRKALAKASLSIINGVFFLCDVFLTFRE